MRPNMFYSWLQTCKLLRVELVKLRRICSRSRLWRSVGSKKRKRLWLKLTDSEALTSSRKSRLVIFCFFILLSSGCSSAVERTPHDREVVGFYPAGFWAFSLLYPILNSGPSWRCNTTDFPIKYAWPCSLRLIKLIRG